MSDLIDTTEMYLRTVFELIEDGVVPMRARIAEQLGHSGPTVSQTVARMERDGLLVVTEDDHHLELTATGRAIATRVMRKHRLAERVLTDVIGLNIAYVHEEACRWEHVMSDLVEERLIDLLSDLSRSPYGNRIPGLTELGVVPDAGGAAPQLMSLEQAATDGVAHGEVVRIGEPAQASPGVLDLMVAAGLLPGASVSIVAVRGGVEADAGKGAVSIDEVAARHIFVMPR
jgi:DtxR family transcriptional regulator, Mn-dependent transcriptional regulator